MVLLAEKRVPKQTACVPTPQNIAQQDFVDNKIFELVNQLLPRRKKIAWNIEVIGNIRDAIFSSARGKVRGMNERKSYP